MVLGYSLAVFVGIVLGALGGGGAVLTVPLLVYVFGVGMKHAVPMSLIVVGLTSLLGVYRYQRMGHLDIGAAIIFGPAAMIGAVLGTEVAFLVSGHVQLLVFGSLLVIAATLMLRRSRAKRQATPVVRRPIILLALIGTGVGFLTGLVGVGGGFMYVPALALLAGLEMHAAVGTSLALIALSCSAGLVRYIGRIDLDWKLTGTVTLLAFVGVAIGAAVASRLPQQTLRRAFAVLLLVMGGFVLFKGEARPAASGSGDTAIAEAPVTTLVADLFHWRS
jgi:uncharacterized membrane protein YfcA